MRCICCDNILTKQERYRRTEDGNYDDFCFVCLSHVYNDFGILDLSWTADIYDDLSKLDDKIQVTDIYFPNFDDLY